MPIVPFLPHEPRRLDLFADPPDDDAVASLRARVERARAGHPVPLRARERRRAAPRATTPARGRSCSPRWSAGRSEFSSAVGLAVAAGLHLPRRLGWRELVVIALATSSGFTFALFFATGCLAIGPVLAQINVGALATAAGALLALGAARLLARRTIRL